MNKTDAALHQLFEANRLLRDAGERLASTVGQTHARRMVLQAAEDGATVSEMARKLGLHRQGVQRIADELVDEGLGIYVENPHHRISKVFVVTEQGTAVLSAIQRAHNKWVGTIKADAKGIDWITLSDNLDRLVKLLHDQE